MITPFNQPLDEPALAAQAPLQASHPAIIVLVIICNIFYFLLRKQGKQQGYSGA